MKLVFKTLICLLVLYPLNSQVMAQQGKDNADKEGAFMRFIHNEKVAIKFDYFGELVLHPGFSLGIDYTLTNKKWVTFHWDTDFGGFWHKWNNTSLFIKSSVGTRFPVWTMFVDLNLGAGYMHSFAAGTIYKRSEDGGVEKVTNWGHPHFMPTFSILLGYDGGKKMNCLLLSILE